MKMLDRHNRWTTAWELALSANNGETPELPAITVGR